MSRWVSNCALTMFCPHGKGSLLECHGALPSAHRQRIRVARSRLPLVISGNEGLLPGYVGVGPSERTRTPAEQRLKRTWGPGCPWGPQPQERPTDWTQVPWFPPCLLPPHPVLCLGACARTLFLPPVPVTCVWSVMTSPPSSLTLRPFSFRCPPLRAQPGLVQIPMRRELVGPSAFHLRPLSWALANLWIWAASLSQSFEAQREEGWTVTRYKTEVPQGCAFDRCGGWNMTTVNNSDNWHY